MFRVKSNLINQGNDMGIYMKKISRLNLKFEIE